jgi:hypothetical protein
MFGGCGGDACQDAVGVKSRRMVKASGLVTSHSHMYHSIKL